MRHLHCLQESTTVACGGPCIACSVSELKARLLGLLLATRCLHPLRARVAVSSSWLWRHLAVLVQIFAGTQFSPRLFPVSEQSFVSKWHGRFLVRGGLYNGEVPRGLRGVCGVGRPVHLDLLRRACTTSLSRTFCECLFQHSRSPSPLFASYQAFSGNCRHCCNVL